METKKILGTALVAFGLLGLVPGVLGIFQKQELLGVNSWALTILCFILFMAGVGIVQSIRGRSET